MTPVSRRTTLALLFLLALGFSLATMAAAGILVTRIQTRPQDQEYLLDLGIEYNFSPTALEALSNGVPLTIEAQIQVRRKHAWIWEENLIDLRQLMLIRYQPLSRLYQVVRLPNGPKQSFVTRDAAISALGEISDLHLLQRDRLDTDEHYLMHIKVSLDIEALPLPLRPVAYLTPSWNLSSGWTKWPLEP